MTPERKVELDALVARGEAMKSAALKADWEATAVAQDRFRKCAESFFAEPVAAEDAEQVADALRELLSLHDYVSRLVQGRREALAKRLYEVHTGRQAVSAYAQSAG